MNSATIIVRKSEIPSTKMDEDVGVLNVETGKYFAFEGTGAKIWDYIESDISIEAVIEKLMAEYEVDENTCKTEVIAFLEKIHTEGLIEIKNG